MAFKVDAFHSSFKGFGGCRGAFKVDAFQSSFKGSGVVVALEVDALFKVPSKGFGGCCGF